MMPSPSDETGDIRTAISAKLVFPGHMTGNPRERPRPGIVRGGPLSVQRREPIPGHQNIPTHQAHRHHREVRNQPATTPRSQRRPRVPAVRARPRRPHRSLNPTPLTPRRPADTRKRDPSSAPLTPMRGTPALRHRHPPEVNDPDPTSTRHRSTHGPSPQPSPTSAETPTDH